MSGTTPNYHPLYLAALAADEDFQTALVAVYGPRASEARYLPAWKMADSVRRFASAKIAADAAWLGEIAAFQGRKS